MGSNVGNRPARLRAAVRALDSLPGTRVVRLSPVYETSAVGPPQRDFLNAVAEIRTELSPSELLVSLKSAERRLGRRRRKKWGPREIDLDFLYFGRRILRGEPQVPHPRAAGRRFVLRPMADLAPGFKDPSSGRTVSVLLGRLTDPDQSVRLLMRKLPWKK